MTCTYTPCQDIFCDRGHDEPALWRIVELEIVSQICILNFPLLGPRIVSKRSDSVFTWRPAHSYDRDDYRRDQSAHAAPCLSVVIPGKVAGRTVSVAAGCGMPASAWQQRA